MFHKKINILILATLSILCLSILFAFLPFISTEKVIFSYFNKPYPEKYADIDETFIKNRGYKVVMSKFDLANPIYTIIFELGSPDDQSYKAYSSDVFELKRKNLFSFEIKEVRLVSTKNLTFDQIIEYAKKGDISKNNPDPKNITVYPPKTPEQIQSTKKANEINQNPDYRKKRDDCDKFVPNLQTATSQQWQDYQKCVDKE